MSASQQMQLRELLRRSSHPRVVDDFLIRCGLLREQLEQAYDDLNLRRSHLLERYRMKRHVQWVGACIVLLVVGIGVIHQGQVSIILSGGLIAYGIALIVTGNLKVGLLQESKASNARWIRQQQPTTSASRQPNHAVKS